MGSIRNFFLERPLRAFLLNITLATQSVLIAGCTLFPFGPEVPADTGGASFSEYTKMILDIPDHITRTKASGWWQIKSIDIFVFNDDNLKELDTYCHKESYSTYGTVIPSGKGAKIAVIIANFELDANDLASISRYGDLEEICAEFNKDSAEYPVMSGECVYEAGTDRECHITLTPIMSQIEITSLKCHMNGAFEGKHLEKVKVYLTGINNRCELMRYSGFRPSEILNQYELTERDMQKLDNSGKVYKYLGSGKSDGIIYDYGHTSLFCYPNDINEESPGAVFTRLIIEGEIGGKSQRYSIDINRANFGWIDGQQGIGRNTRYCLDIMITCPNEISGNY